MKNERLTKALAKLDGLFDKGALDWLISMYDPKSRGMYYAASSRDNAEFEPDIESTVQTVSLLDKLGLITECGNGKYDIPDWFEKDVYSFLSARQDGEDGYMYDPVYRTEAGKEKKERNTVFTVNCLKNYFGKKLPYPTPMERLGTAEARASATDSDQTMYATKESYLAWLEQIRNTCPDSYHWGSYISSGRSMITATGYKQTTIDWLIKNQNKENGTWEKEFGMTAVNGVLKISGYFGEIGFPNYEIYAKNVIDFTKTFEPGTAAACWNAMGSLLVVLRTIPGGASADVRERLEEDISEMIENTVVQMKKFRQPDGGFSYGKKGSSVYSNAVRVSLGLPEGDVNALSLMSLIYNDAYALAGVEKSNVWAKHRDHFWSEIKARRRS